MSLYIEPAATISKAWLATLNGVRDAGGCAVNVLTTVTDPQAPEDNVLRAALDELLVRGYRNGTRIQSVETVAATLFPTDLYVDPGYDYDPSLSAAAIAQLDAAADNMYQAYSMMLPLLRTDSGNRNGTYFARMVSWPGKTANGHNQLADRIHYLRVLARRRNVRRLNVNDITVAGQGDFPVSDGSAPVPSAAEFGDGRGDRSPDLGLQEYAADDRRTRGFPCLVHIDLTLYRNQLHMLGVYRHQYLVTKAYGNILGLARLQRFLTHQTGFGAGELAIQASFADAETSTWSKSTLGVLAPAEPAGVS